MMPDPCTAAVEVEIKPGPILAVSMEVLVLANEMLRNAVPDNYPDKKLLQQRADELYARVQSQLDDRTDDA